MDLLHESRDISPDGILSCNVSGTSKTVEVTLRIFEEAFVNEIHMQGGVTLVR